MHGVLSSAYMSGYKCQFPWVQYGSANGRHPVGPQYDKAYIFILISFQLEQHPGR